MERPCLCAARRQVVAMCLFSCLSFAVVPASVYAILPPLDVVNDDSVLKVEAPSAPAELATVVKLFVNAEGDGERWSYRVEVFQKEGAPAPEGVMILRRPNEKQELLRKDLEGLAPGRPAIGAIELSKYGFGPCVVEVGVSESGKMVSTARDTVYFLDGSWRKADYSAKVLLPPWTPMKVRQDGAVECWGRSYKFANTLLPASIMSQKTELLSRPVELVVTRKGRRLAPAHLTTPVSEKTETSYEATATGALAKNVTYTGHSTLEYDGLVMIDLALKGKGLADVSSVDVNIPVRGEIVNYIYRTGQDRMWVFGKTLIREKPGIGHFGLAPLLPNLSGEVKTESLPGVLTSADFMPLAWMGNDDVGLFWFCDSNRAWPHSRAGKEDSVAFVDEGDSVVLRMRIQALPEKLPNPWKLRFGIMGTPMKPGASGSKDRPRGWGLTATEKVRAGLLWPISKTVWDLFWPDPVDPADCRKTVQQLWKKGETPVFYSAFGLSAARPDGKVYGEAWHLDGAQDDHWDNVNYRPGMDAPLLATCPGVGMGFGEYFAYYLGEFIKEYDYGGYYRDGMFIGPCANQGHGHGIGGAVDYHMESLRRHFRYLYRVVKEQHPDKGWVIGHSSGLLALPLFAYCDSVVTAETLSAVNNYRGDYRKVVSLDEYRSEYMGRSKGFVSIYIGQIRGENVTVANTRLLMALLLLHDIVPWEDQMHIATSRRILTTIDRKFGIADTEYLPYFKKETPAKIAGDGLYVSLYKQPGGRTLAVVANLSDKNLRSWLRFDAAGLGLERISRAYDIENDMNFPIENNAVRVVVRARDFRLIEVR